MYLLLLPYLGSYVFQFPLPLYVRTERVVSQKDVYIVHAYIISVSTWFVTFVIFCMHAKHCTCLISSFDFIMSCKCTGICLMSSKILSCQGRCTRCHALLLCIMKVHLYQMSIIILLCRSAVTKIFQHRNICHYIKK